MLLYGHHLKEGIFEVAHTSFQQLLKMPETVLLQYLVNCFGATNE